DYVMISNGSGAIVAVPAHDERDFAFAIKYDLPIRQVIRPEDAADTPLLEAYSGAGAVVNSDDFNGTRSHGHKVRNNAGIDEVISWIETKDIGKISGNDRLRDWLISRQRYWGSPIPMIYTEDGAIQPVANEDLPVMLPEDVEFLPRDRSPLTYP